MLGEEYCRQTSLHGWQYISSSSQQPSLWKAFWILIVLSSFGTAFLLVCKAVDEFTRSTVVTTIYSTNVPLSEVYFPSVTVCNINQVRKSFFKDFNINGNRSIVDFLYEQFYTGSVTRPSESQLNFLKDLFTSEKYVKREYEYHSASKGNDYNNNNSDSNWMEYLDKHREWIQKGFQFTRLAVQEPNGVMILQASYGTKKRFGNITDFNPYFGTDYGICSIIKPQTAFNSNLQSVPYWDKIFGPHNWQIEKGAQVGKANGLSMLLDAETFDYTFHLKAGEGFKIAIHHHLDQPIMSIRELDISPGSVFQIAITPTLLSTTTEARSRFTPLERGCYFEGELPLLYLPSHLYRYEMSNCLFEAAYEEILTSCNCTPSFHQLASREVPQICTGLELTCMNRILRFIGKLNKVGKEQQECLSACEDQINSVVVTSSDFPNRETFVKREEFCLALIKLMRTCQSGKREFLTQNFPSICFNIQRVIKTKDMMSLYCGSNNIWKGNWMSQSAKYLLSLENDVFTYAQKNLAVVNVYIRDPVVTNIKRDQKIPVIAFVANTGGLLGLCMGFSLVSLFEIVFHCLLIGQRVLRRRRKKEFGSREGSENVL